MSQPQGKGEATWVAGGNRRLTARWSVTACSDRAGSGSFGEGTGSAEHTEDAEEATMLALVVAALVPTAVMTAALALERLERCVLRHVPMSLDKAHVDRRGDAVDG